MKSQKGLKGRDISVLLILGTVGANLNKAMLHMDTHMHTYTDTESDLIASDCTESEP